MITCVIKQKNYNISKLNKIVYVKNNKFMLNLLDTINNWLILQKRKEYLKWLRRWNYENLIISNMHKQYLLYRTYNKKMYKYLKFLNIFFINVIESEFKLTNSMLMKALLWTAPDIYVYWNLTPLIELRTLEIRIRRLKTSKIIRWRWKIYRSKKRRVIIEKLPRMLYLQPVYW